MVNVQPKVWELVRRIVRSMEQIILNLSVNFAVILLNGFAGELRTFVNHVTLSKIMEIMFHAMKEVNCLNVRELLSVL